MCAGIPRGIQCFDEVINPLLAGGNLGMGVLEDPLNASIGADTTVEDRTEVSDPHYFLLVVLPKRSNHCLFIPFRIVLGFG